MSTLSRRQLLELAQDPHRTPFDYIVVGSGAGGGPLAARLALGGKSVLVLEAGPDPAVPNAAGGDPLTTQAFDPQTWRDVYAVPGYCAAVTEDPDISWHFSVRHYQDDARQDADRKYSRDRDPSSHVGGKGKGGIHYPRCAAIGGCTAHHAMVVVRPNDCDWEQIADLTGDESWRAANMQGYFARLETCLYGTIYQGYLREKLGIVYRFLRKLAAVINPRWELDPGGHGFRGWQATSFISPTLLELISQKDATFTRLLLRVAVAALAGRRGQLLRQGLARLQLFQIFDPNDINQRRRGLSSLAFIPTGTDGARRHGVREWLLDTAKDRPDRLVIEAGVHVERILFTPGSTVPKACGVTVAEDLFLYEASPKRPHGGASSPTKKNYFAKQEIVVCAGAFNTPQLLMLSGIGDKAHLAAHGVDGLYGPGGKVSGVVHLPGVGENLQDRYEVSVVSQASSEFSMLKDVTFRPGDLNDPALKAWRNKRGLYTTNGCAMALFVNSGAASSHPEVPDLFIFGIPAAFRGYYPGWPNELLRDGMGAPNDQRDLWSWVILKAYTNNRGTVRLRSNAPDEQPEIDFNYFEQGTPGATSDAEALSTGIAYVRWLNERTRGILSREIQPGNGYPDGSPQLADWICNEAWGHHACGTCRIGSVGWQEDTSKLLDPGAVLDSNFQVHGVHGLRVADASVFREIPGYFLAAATFMIGEKAADTLLADSISYPQALESVEADAIAERREVAHPGASGSAGSGPHGGVNSLPPDTVGLALSGGGIRSATFCLGVLQALAAKNRLRDVDILSTVSGGGFSGSFLGRLFTTVRTEVADKVGHVQKLLTDPQSAQIWWIRKHADYIAARGRSDWRINLGIYWRNLLAVHLCVGAFLLVFFGGARWLSDAQWRELGARPTAQSAAQQPAASQPPAPATAVSGTGGAASTDPAGRPRTPPTLLEKAKEKVPPSPWWWAPLAILCLGVVPLSLSFWLTPLGGTSGAYPLFPLLAWLALVGGAVAGLSLPAAAPWAGLALAMLLVAWVWQEVSRWRLPPGTPARERSVVVRNRLGRYLGRWLIAFLAALALVLLDAIAWAVAHSQSMPAVATTSGVLVLLAPVVRRAMEWLAARARDLQGGKRSGILGAVSSPALGFALAVFLLFGIDVLAHVAFESGGALGAFVVLLALAFSLLAGRAFDVLNRSSLQSAYAERLSRTFLGATNPARTHPPDDPDARDVRLAHPGDDLPFHAYHPERDGGPLHLINVCINETVDVVSERALRGDKGLPMCVGPLGVSVGRRFHALWEKPPAGLRRPRSIGARLRQALENPGPVTADEALRPVPVAPDPNAFHVFGRRMDPADAVAKQVSVRRNDADAAVERLRLSQWMAISGAALTTGMGRETHLSTALVRGLLNLRSGYWWDSGIDGADRPGRYPPDLLSRLRSLPSVFFKMQFKILDEWRARFAGPSDRHWHLTDGGHFENMALYELVRRRLPLIIAVDATRDPQYQFGDLAILARQVRLDFGAQLCWIDPTSQRQRGQSGWTALRAAAGTPAVPHWIESWLDADALGTQAQMSRTGSHAAALARITYDDAPGKVSWLVLVKTSVPADVPLDVRAYAVENPDFPNDPTLDQFFTDAQWESYRKLGQSLGSRIFRSPP